jgi:hypothetical protein
VKQIAGAIRNEALKPLWPVWCQLSDNQQSPQAIGCWPRFPIQSRKIKFSSRSLSVQRPRDYPRALRDAF